MDPRKRYARDKKRRLIGFAIAAVLTWLLVGVTNRLHPANWTPLTYWKTVGPTTTHLVLYRDAQDAVRVVSEREFPREEFDYVEFLNRIRPTMGMVMVWCNPPPKPRYVRVPVLGPILLPVITTDVGITVEPSARSFLTTSDDVTASVRNEILSDLPNIDTVALDDALKDVRTAARPARYIAVTREHRWIWWPGLVLRLVLLALIGSLLVLLPQHLKAVRALYRLAKWKVGPPFPCPECGYDVSGSESRSLCTECGFFFGQARDDGGGIAKGP